MFDNCGGNKREALEYLQHHVEQLLTARPVPNHVTSTVSLNDLEHVLKGYTTLLRVLDDYAYIEQIFGLPTWLVFVSRALQSNEHVIQGTLKHWQLEHRGLLADVESARRGDGTVPAERMEHMTRTLDQLALLANRSEHYKAAVKLFYEVRDTVVYLRIYFSLTDTCHSTAASSHATGAARLQLCQQEFCPRVTRCETARD